MQTAQKTDDGQALPRPEGPALKRPEGLTPMMEQYWDVKQAHPDCLIFYRMGDFYELFYQDALDAAPALDIALTKRGKGADGQDIPMCGVPAHSYETYLPRLIRAGFKVAVCEQVETPEQAKKRGGYKALVKRDVVRIITAGTLTEDHLLASGMHAYLSCIFVPAIGHAGVAWLDISTGAFYTQACLLADLPALLARIAPEEILMQDSHVEDPRLFETLAPYRTQITLQPKSLFDAKNAHKRLLDCYQIATLDGFGNFEGCEITAAGSLLDYARLTQKGTLPHIRRLEGISADAVLDMDASTRRNLEITKTLSGERKGSLLHCLDTTKTSAGSRLLAQRLAQPSCDIATIQQRHEQIAAFQQHDHLAQRLCDHLSRMADIERALARITLGRGNPRDLGQIRDALHCITAMRGDLLEMPHDTLSPISKALHFAPDMTALHDTLSRALADELPLLAREGGYIAHGYSTQLDEFRSLRKNGREAILTLEQNYSTETNISSLKIKYNNVLGWFIDVTSKHADHLLTWSQTSANDAPETPKSHQRTNFIHRQTLASAVRFTTTELTELEGKIAQASDRAIAIEGELFDQMIAQTLTQAAPLSELARVVAQIDISVTMALLARQRNYTRPTMHADTQLTIKGGRHPVVEVALQQQSGTGAFVTNDCTLAEAGNLWLLTGPNMAGKSTFLRQNAVITLMAQAGLYVPADHADIGVVDRLFSRVGAADDLARGQSTFMVEMVETAAILNRATDRSLVILDEIGRGTATFDGLSIAWATLEYLHEKNQCRTLFATHYHELTQLRDTLPRLRAARVDVKEWQGDIVFLHKVVEGAADQSYGIHVARIAGIPKSVLKRAQTVLKGLEQEKASHTPQDLPLFQMVEDAPAHEAGHHAVLEALQALNPDDMSPKDALQALYLLKEAAQD